MRKAHYLSFIAQANDRGADTVKLWPGMVPQAHFLKQGGTIYAYCNRHGLFKVKM